MSATPATAGTERQVWRIDLIADGKRVRRFVSMHNRADAETQRWWWKADDGAGSATLHHATREVVSAEWALHDAQTVILYDVPRGVILSVKLADHPKPGGA